MTYLLIGIAVTAWFFLLAFLFHWVVDDGSFLPILLLFLWLSISTACVLWMMEDAKKRGPCLRYETGMQFNPATKTMMPYRVCAERGEWIEETPK